MLLKAIIKYDWQSSNMIGNSDDETNFPHKFLLTNRQVDVQDVTIRRISW